MRAVFFAVVMLGSAALADAVDVQLTARGLRGQSQPQMVVRILEPIAGFRVQLKRSDGKTLDVKGGGAVGQEQTIRFEHPDGAMTWEGGLSVNYPNATKGFMPLQFTTEIYGPLKVTFDKSADVDLEKRRVTLKLTRPAAKVKLKVLMDTGEYAFDGEVPFNGEPAGTPLNVTWPEAKGHIMRINIEGYDAMGYFAGFELLPWRIDIPHEEVQFDSGKSDIRGSERGKLDTSLKLIVDAINKYGQLAPIKLFVAGHTDSVGPTASNRALSVRRAQSLATFFRSNGVRVPIHYEGFGEEAPLVQTDDEVDEPRNRRAEYIISVEEPTVHNASVAPKWRRL